MFNNRAKKALPISGIFLSIWAWAALDGFGSPALQHFAWYTWNSAVLWLLSPFLHTIPK